MLDGVLEPPKEVEVAIGRGLSVAEEASLEGDRGQVDQVWKEEGWIGGSSGEPLAVVRSCRHQEARKSCQRLDWKCASEQGALHDLLETL